MHEKLVALDSFSRQYAVPLVSGIFAGILYANVAPNNYEYIFGVDGDSDHFQLIPDAKLFGYYEITIAFVINDIFMCFFFGLAAKGITESILPNGSMYPINRAIVPLISTVGGIVTPIIVYICFSSILFGLNGFSSKYTYGTIINGWGIPTATDISLAWVVGSWIFKQTPQTAPGTSVSSNANLNESQTQQVQAQHPCISYLLLLAIVDDGIGLFIIAIFYSDPNSTIQWQYLPLILLLLIVLYLNKHNFFICINNSKKNSNSNSTTNATCTLNQKWWFFIFIMGPFSWIVFLLCKVHPALALVPVVPFIGLECNCPGCIFKNKQEISEPANGKDENNSNNNNNNDTNNENKDETSVNENENKNKNEDDESIDELSKYERYTKPFVDYGLFFFTLCNAGVTIGSDSVGLITLCVTVAIIVGKIIGISTSAFIVHKYCCHFPLPNGMNANKDLLRIGFVGSMSLTVALFVSTVAFTEKELRSQAKLGALIAATIVMILAALYAVYLNSNDSKYSNSKSNDSNMNNNDTPDVNNEKDEDEREKFKD